MSLTKARKPSTGKGKKKSTALIALFSVLAVLIALTAGAAVYIIKSAVTPPETDPYDTFYSGTQEPDETNVGTETSDPGEDPPESMTRLPGSYNFLVLGMDKASYSTDVIMLVNFRTDSGTVSILQIPRDTYLQIDGSGGKINRAYNHFRNQAIHEGVSDPKETALSRLTTLLQNELNVKIDYYALIDLAGFRSIVDHIGGVPVDLPGALDYDDPDQGLYIHLKAGQQTLNGVQAEGLVRFRYTYALADIGRTDAQKIFMSAFIRQVKNNFNVTTIAGLISDVIQYVTSDISLSDCIHFAKEALGVDMGNISMMTMQGNGYNGGVYYIMCREWMIQILNERFNLFDKAIPDDLFDVDKVFTSKDNRDLNALYLQEAGKYKVYTADTVNEEGIYIPLNPNRVKK